MDKPSWPRNYTEETMDLLLFTIASSTSDVPDDPFCLLPYSKGWTSPKLCDYPQEIVLELDGDTAVSEANLWAVSGFVPSKVELFALRAGGDAGAQFARADTLSPGRRAGEHGAVYYDKRVTKFGGVAGSTPQQWERIGDLQRNVDDTTFLTLRAYTQTSAVLTPPVLEQSPRGRTGFF